MATDVIDQLRGVEALALGLMIPAMDRGEQRPLTVTELGEVVVACGTAAVALESQRFACKVRAAGKTDPPQDCDWPFCGCDEHATKVIDTLQECDLLRPRSDVGTIDSLKALKDAFIDGWSARARFEGAPLIDAETAYAAYCEAIAKGGA
jgi:hypothetical protein